MAIMNALTVERHTQWSNAYKSCWATTFFLSIESFVYVKIHPNAEHAAETAEFATAHGRFWQMHDLLYENQQTLEDEFLFQLADELGLSADRLRESLVTEAYRARIDMDFRGGVRSGVNGTPT